MVNFFELFNIIKDDKQEILTEGLLDNLPNPDERKKSREEIEAEIRAEVEDEWKDIKPWRPAKAQRRGNREMPPYDPKKATSFEYPQSPEEEPGVVKSPSPEISRVPDPDPITQEEFEKGLQGWGTPLPDDLRDDPGKLNIRGRFERTDISAWHFYLQLLNNDEKEAIATEFPDIATKKHSEKSITRSQMQKAWMNGFSGDRGEFRRGKDGSLPDPNQWYGGLGRKGATIDIGHISQGPSRQRQEERLWNIKHVLKNNLPREEWEQIEPTFDKITGEELAKGKDMNLDLALKQIKEKFPEELERAYEAMPKNKRKGFDWLSHRAYKHLRKRSEFLELQKMDLKDRGNREEIFKKVIHGIEGHRGLKFEKEFSTKDILEKIKEKNLHIKSDNTEYSDEELKEFLDDMAEEIEGSPRILEPITTQGLLGKPRAIGYKRPRIQDPSAIEGDDQWVENQFRKQKVNLGRLELLVKRGEDNQAIQKQLKEVKNNIDEAVDGILAGWASVGYFSGLYKRWSKELESIKDNVISSEDLTFMVNNVLKKLEEARNDVVDLYNIKEKDEDGNEVGPGFIEERYPELLKGRMSPQEESVLNEMLVLAGLKES